MEQLITFPEAWELHPMLVHFPIALLLGGAVLMLWAVRWPSETLNRTATGLLLVGDLSGWLAAAAGGLRLPIVSGPLLKKICFRASNSPKRYGFVCFTFVEVLDTFQVQQNSKKKLRRHSLVLCQSEK